MEIPPDPPEPRAIEIDENSGHWLVRLENGARRETPHQAREPERNQKPRDLKRFLKNDDRFTDFVRSLRRMHFVRRPRALEEYWEGTYEDAMAQVRQEYLGWMGQTSAWESNIALKFMDYEEALATDPIVASWISFAQNAALG
jgi:hypothetical protein